MIEELSHRCKTKGLINIENKNISLGINSLMEGIKINNKDIDLLNILGLVLYKKCNFNDAMYLFQRSVKLKSNSRSNKYLEWMESEEFKTFLKSYNEGIEALNDNKFDDAIKILTKITIEDSSLIEPYILLTEAYIRKEDYENSRLMLREVCNRDIGEEKIQYYRGILNKRNECISGCLEEGKFIIETSFNHTERAEFRFLLGLSYEETCEFDIAIEEYQKYLEESKKESYIEVALYNLARLCNKVGRYEESKNYGQRLLVEYSDGKYNNDEIKNIVENYCQKEK